MSLQRINDDLRCPHTDGVEGQTPGFHPRHVEEVLDEAIDPARGPLDALRLPAAAAQERRLHEDCVQRISQIVRNDPEHLAPRLDSLLSRVVQPRVLQGERCVPAHLLQQVQIGGRVASFGTTRCHYERSQKPPMDGKRDAHHRGGTEFLQQAPTLIVLCDRADRLGSDLCRQLRLIRLENRPTSSEGGPDRLEAAATPRQSRLCQDPRCPPRVVADRLPLQRTR